MTDVVERAKAALEANKHPYVDDVSWEWEHASAFWEVHGNTGAAKRWDESSRSLIPELIAELEELRTELAWLTDNTEVSP